MRLLFVTALLMMPACLTQCDGASFGHSSIDAVGSMHGGEMSHGAARGDMTPPAGAAAPAVVGIDWPEGGAYGTLEILFEPEKETTFANADPMPSITNFGALTLDLTRILLSGQPQYQSPCSVGPSMACAYFDGGDRLQDSGVRATLAILHDGTGASCYLITEPSSASGATANVVTTQTVNPGNRWSFTSSTTDRLGTLITNAASTVVNRPTAGTGLQDQTWGYAWSFGMSQDPDFVSEYWGVGAPTGPTGNVSAAVSTADPGAALAVGTQAAIDVATGGSPYTGSLFAFACYSSTHTATEFAGVKAAVEARTGALPQ